MDTDNEGQPLLRGNMNKKKIYSINIQHWFHRPFDSHGENATIRQHVARFLSSRAGHYSVLTLVGLDVAGIFTDFVLRLFQCEDSHPGVQWDDGIEALGILSLVFSCLFMLELVASVWAFGFGYFRSWFHCLDALVIVAGLILDILLQGTLEEEAASLIVILRLWRVFKIIEELSVGAKEGSEETDERIAHLEKENKSMRQQIAQMKSQLNSTRTAQS